MYLFSPPSPFCPTAMASSITGREHGAKSCIARRSFCLAALCATTAYVVLFLVLFQIWALKPRPLTGSFLVTWNSLQQALQVNANVSNVAAGELDRIRAKLRDSITFLPLRDSAFSHPLHYGGNWFISSIPDTHQEGDVEYMYFPSEASKGRLLCVEAHNTTEGARNSYALAYREALPHNSTLLTGLTYVSDTVFKYDNIYHGLSAVVPFVSWHQKKGCVAPARWTLFHCGMLRTIKATSDWVRTLARAATGVDMYIEDYESYWDGPVCFEEAVVFRHNEGKMQKPRRLEIYDMIRCKVREYCEVPKESTDPRKVQMTLLLRKGARSFKNESAVIRVFQEACEKAKGCKFKYGWGDNLTFCDQVKLMADTDLLVSQHGAQVTNLVFMDRNSSVIEMYPKGWKEFGGTGQFVYRWLSNYSGMQHRGSWWDAMPEGEKCPYRDPHGCFLYYKNGQVGHDEAYFSEWAAKVLDEVAQHKLSTSNRPMPASATCPCS